MMGIGQYDMHGFWVPTFTPTSTDSFAMNFHLHVKHHFSTSSWKHHGSIILAIRTSHFFHPQPLSIPQKIPHGFQVLHSWRGRRDQVLDVDSLDFQQEQLPLGTSGTAFPATELLYVMFTSGSTGRPKADGLRTGAKPAELWGIWRNWWGKTGEMLPLETQNELVGLSIFLVVQLWSKAKWMIRSKIKAAMPSVGIFTSCATNCGWFECFWLL